MNSLSLVGRLTRPPELRTTQSGTPVCDMRIAVDGRGPDAAPLYLDIATFGESANACARYLTKGREIAFSGQLVYREWEVDGQRHSKHSATGHVEFLGKRPDTPGDDGDADEPAPARSRGQRQTAGVAAGVGDEDIPF